MLQRLEVRIIGKRINRDDYDNDKEELYTYYYGVEPKRCDRCGRPMVSVIEHIEVWGQRVPTERFYCEVCD